MYPPSSPALRRVPGTGHWKQRNRPRIWLPGAPTPPPPETLDGARRDRYLGQRGPRPGPWAPGPGPGSWQRALGPGPRDPGPRPGPRAPGPRAPALWTGPGPCLKFYAKLVPSWALASVLALVKTRREFLDVLWTSARTRALPERALSRRLMMMMMRMYSMTGFSASQRPEFLFGAAHLLSNWTANVWIFSNMISYSSEAGSTVLLLLLLVRMFRLSYDVIVYVAVLLVVSLGANPPMVDDRCTFWQLISCFN